MVKKFRGTLVQSAKEFLTEAIRLSHYRIRNLVIRVLFRASVRKMVHSSDVCSNLSTSF
jgi:hypothetical protein